MTVPKVYFMWDTDLDLKEFLRSGLSGIETKLYFKDELSESEIENIIPQMDILVGWRPSEDLLKKAKCLSLFINPGAGVQHLKVFKDIFTAQNITVVNGHGNAYFTAQHTVAILLSLMNKVNFHHNAMVDGKWRLGDSEAASIPLRDRNVGFLGYGHVNSLVHKFLSGFDVNFSVLKRTTEYNLNDLHRFLENIDTLIIAVPLTEKTTDLIGQKELELLGNNGIVVNVGRGPIINEKALYEALKEKQIKSAAIDVWYDYQCEADEEGKRYPFNYPFNELDNVLLSPHRAASPFSDLKRWNEVVDNIKRFSKGRTDYMNIVDIDEGY
ncbi:MAG: NAD(P)-dependent oxidoreductase [Candidatus Delongbacteria bacterium]|jgi:phosphoglycerate dehydrogenase-like enzyme|nr:NAD(P)-dependent oxidoreductase [Candidatus Delongbacteria bacterium]